MEIKMARKTVVFTPDKIQAAMKILHNKMPVPQDLMTRYHVSKVLGEELGLVAYEKPKLGHRGRPAGVFVLTENGKKFVRNLRKRELRAAKRTAAVAA